MSQPAVMSDVLACVLTLRWRTTMHIIMIIIIISAAAVVKIVVTQFQVTFGSAPFCCLFFAFLNSNDFIISSFRF